MNSQYLCILDVATAGFQERFLGSDEQEIVLLTYVLICPIQNKVLGVQQYTVYPQVADVNESFLSEETCSITQLTCDFIRSTRRSLNDALNEFSNYCKNIGLDNAINSNNVHFITDGQLPLRQCLHPEAFRKNITLPPYYYRFHDLRKHVRNFIKSQSQSSDEFPTSCEEMLTILQMTSEIETCTDFYKRNIKDLVNIVQRLLRDGCTFGEPERINEILEPGICCKDEAIDTNCVVRARGLPWQSSDQDIAKFFIGLNIARGGVALCLSVQGRRNGEALIRFESEEHRNMALKRNRHHIGNRYIEIYKATGDEFLAIASGSSCEAQSFLSRNADVIIRMRGLPYDCTSEQIRNFFNSGDNACEILDGSDGILFVRKPDGRSTGDAFVLFASESDAPKALSKHREVIGNRYIELFRSTIAEVQQVLNRSAETAKAPEPAIAPLLQNPLNLLPQHVITSGTEKNCIRLRGLPYEAQVENILEFLGEFAKFILFQGVHMVYNAQGQPSGEAFIQMDSETSACLTAQQKHHHYMIFGKKQRYIEVFQCSGEDMNLVLNGGVGASALSPSRTQGLLAGIVKPGLPHNFLNRTVLPSLSAMPLATGLPPHGTAPANLGPRSTTILDHHHPSQMPYVSVPPNMLAHWSPDHTVAMAPNGSATAVAAACQLNPLLAAQQQAQMIAHHNLLMRQNQNENLLLINQLAHRSLALINSQQQQQLHHNKQTTPTSADSGSVVSSTALVKATPTMSPAQQPPTSLTYQTAALFPTIHHPHHSFIYQLPTSIPPIDLHHANLAMKFHPAFMHDGSAAAAAASTSMIPMVPHVAVKRTYCDAFNESAAPSKRSASFATNTLPLHYPSCFTNM